MCTTLSNISVLHSAFNLPKILYLTFFHIFTYSTPAYCQYYLLLTRRQTQTRLQFTGLWGGEQWGSALVTSIWPRNVINLKKNICIMTTLVSFSISKGQNQANKKPLPFPSTPNTNDAGMKKNTPWNKPEKNCFKSSLLACFHCVHLCISWIMYCAHLLPLPKKNMQVLMSSYFLNFYSSFLLSTPFMMNTLGYNTCGTRHSIPPTNHQMLGTRNMQGFFMLVKWWKSAHQR